MVAVLRARAEFDEGLKHHNDGDPAALSVRRASHCLNRHGGPRRLAHGGSGGDRARPPSSRSGPDWHSTHRREDVPRRVSLEVMLRGTSSSPSSTSFVRKVAAEVMMRISASSCRGPRQQAQGRCPRSAVRRHEDRRGPTLRPEPAEGHPPPRCGNRGTPEARRSVVHVRHRAGHRDVFGDRGLGCRAPELWILFSLGTVQMVPVVIRMNHQGRLAPTPATSLHPRRGFRFLSSHPHRR